MGSGQYIRSEKVKVQCLLNFKGYAKKGRKMSDEIKKKISRTMKQKKIFPLEKARVALKGRKFSLERRKKLSNVKKNLYLKSQEYRKRLKRISIKGLLKQQTMKEPTSIEKKVYEELKRRGLLFEKQKLINGRFLVDAYIPSLNLIIEADGDYWHNFDRVKRKDKAENAYLTKCGYKLLRLSEEEINNGSFKNKLD